MFPFDFLNNAVYFLSRNMGEILTHWFSQKKKKEYSIHLKIIVQEIPFPSVAIEVAPKWVRGNSLRIVQDVLDDLRFDCGSHLTRIPGEDVIDCLNKTDGIRQALTPLVEMHLTCFCQVG